MVGPACRSPLPPLLLCVANFRGLKQQACAHHDMAMLTLVLNTTRCSKVVPPSVDTYSLLLNTPAIFMVSAEAFSSRVHDTLLEGDVMLCHVAPRSVLSYMLKGPVTEPAEPAKATKRKPPKSVQQR